MTMSQVLEERGQELTAVAGDTEKGASSSPGAGMVSPQWILPLKEMAHAVIAYTFPSLYYDICTQVLTIPLASVDGKKG